ncbi:MAG: 4Fe-4S dicluster domain-containing protein [Candidatus Thermoplasmatota archaeon]|nr:4Fe-4S dicluster domain-containing protein [Candidatus Thermoplasmatota archaeon]
MFPMIKQVLKQVFKKPFTNKFPVKYAPKNVSALLQKVERGEAQINPPVPTPDHFRGRIVYEGEKCIGCKMCIKVCPAKVIEFREEEKKIRMYVARCIFCSQCVDVCPVNCLHISDTYLLAHTDRLDPETLIVE